MLAREASSGGLPQMRRTSTWRCRSYTALGVSESQRQRVYEYIANQQSHHKRVDFDCEYVSLLKCNEIRFDLERLWKSEG